MFISDDEYYCSCCKGVCNQNKDQKGIFPCDTPGLTLKLLDCYYWWSFGMQDVLATAEVHFIIRIKRGILHWQGKSNSFLNINFVDAVKWVFLRALWTKWWNNHQSHNNVHRYAIFFIIIIIIFTIIMIFLLSVALEQLDVMFALNKLLWEHTNVYTSM